MNGSQGMESPIGYFNPKNLMNIMMYKILLMMFVLQSGYATALPYKLFFFEQNNVPQEFTAGRKDRLSISSLHYKDGQHSLKWKYHRGSALVVDTDIGFKSESRHSFILWVYNERPIDDHLVFQFGTGEKVNTEFSSGLNFKGWRAMVIHFDSEMEGDAIEGMNRLTIVAPKSVRRGSLYFDQMGLSIPVDPRWPTPDYQLPSINEGVNDRPNSHWTGLLQYDSWLQTSSMKTYSPASDAELKAIQVIEQRVDSDLIGVVADSRPKQIRHIQKIYQSYFFKDNKGNNRLRPVIMIRELGLFKRAKIPSSDFSLLDDDSLRFMDIGKFMFKLARTYRASTDQNVKRNLQEMFAVLFVHLSDQGFARGSGRGVMHHQGYSMREWAKSLYLMRNSMGAQKYLLQDQLSWYTGLGRIFQPEGRIVGFNVDVMNTFLQGMLFSILMEDDEDLRVAYLRQMTHWMSYSTLNIKGLAGGIQSDGSFFHHRQHYVAYGNGGLKGLAPVVYYFSRTPFAFSYDSHKKIKHSILMTRIFSNDLKVPMSLVGRHPTGKLKIDTTSFKYLALAGSPGGDSGYDREIGSAYLRLMEDEKRDAFSKELRLQGLQAEQDPTGSWVMNYSSLVLHRRDNWLVSARGFSRYLVGNETYAHNNHFGRYLNYGHLEILPADSENRGFKEEGWDWNRWPGTTAVHLPLRQLAARLGGTDGDQGTEEMLLSDEAFSGGNQLNGEAAMFAMKLHGHSKYNDDLRAKKSVFFFDDLIVALGSGIESSNKNHQTETTLFQESISSDELSISPPSDPVRNVYITDKQGNSYYVPAGQQVIVQSRNQDSVENEGVHPTSGAFSTAYINHGYAPSNDGYEYAILIGGGRDYDSDSIADRYRVMQNDNIAHVVYHPSTNTVGYAIFEASDDISHGILRSLDTPAMLMIKPSQEGIDIAFTDPDLNLYQGKDRSQYDKDGKRIEKSVYSRSWRFAVPVKKTARFTLEGNWTSESNDKYRIVSSSKGVTTVDVDSVAGTPVHLRLGKLNNVTINIEK